MMFDAAKHLTGNQPAAGSLIISKLPPSSWHWFIRSEFKIQDMWMGIFWQTSTHNVGLYKAHRFDVWLCLIPCLPLHFRLEKRLIPLVGV